jgi:hypothetical protein
MIGIWRHTVKNEALFQLFLLTYIVCFWYKGGMRNNDRFNVVLGWWWPVEYIADR